MLNLKTLEVDPKLAREGVWLDYMHGRFLVARKGPEYDRCLAELYQEHHELIRSDTPEGRLKVIDIYREAFARHILLDWDKVVDDEKNPIPYTPEIGLELARNPLQIELIGEIERFSNIHSNYRTRVEQEIAEDVKNSADS